MRGIGVAVITRTSGAAAFVHQFLALQDAEAVLLVHDHQAQPREFHLRFEQRVRPDDELRRAGPHARERRLFLRRLSSR